MAVPIERIYYVAMRNYQMKLISGKKGIHNLVEWIHNMEDIDVTRFLKGRELVVITGISRIEENRLVDFAKSIYDRKCAGLVVFIGPYIKRVPEDLIAFSEEHNFPVFTLPWEVKLVEFNRELCEIIWKSDQEKNNLCKIVKNIIFESKHFDKYMLELSSEGIYSESEFCMIKTQIVTQDHKDDTEIFLKYRFHCERILENAQLKYVIFKYEQTMTIVVFNSQGGFIDDLTNGIMAFGKQNKEICDCYVAVGKRQQKVEDMPKHNVMLDKLCKYGMLKQQHLMRWEDSGYLTLLLAIEDKRLLLDYYKNTIGRIEQHDIEYNTDYLEILKSYLDHDGNMKMVADECFLHRNTIAYHLKKISEMIGCDIYRTEDRVQLSLAITIKEMMSL